jgi:hypothetical protein
MKSMRGMGLDSILECAVVVSWRDLLRSEKLGLVHVDYCFNPTGAVDRLSLWLSTARGHWHLACEYRMTTSSGQKYGVCFEPGYESAELASNLEFIMQHQDAFSPAANHGRDGLLQIPAPTRDQTAIASAVIAEAHSRAASGPCSQ